MEPREQEYQEKTIQIIEFCGKNNLNIVFDGIVGEKQKFWQKNQ